ncbi:MAG: dTDP-glucose 4,6-dehydratase [Thermodesulfobacteriota bacterium]
MKQNPINRANKIKNLLVTGGCGFIGSNFIRYILKEARFKGNVINLDKLTYAGNYENLIDIEKKFSKKYKFVKGDICNYGLLEKLFIEHKIDAISHFAAETHVDRSIIRPNNFIKTNIIGTYNLLRVANNSQNNFILFHHISTDEVYGSLGADGLFTEDTAFRPNSPYSASKASSDHLVRSYFKTYNLPVTISNCSNNYGPYQFPEKLVPLIILNSLEGKEVPIYGDGKNVRDWLHVDDHSRAVWLILKKGVAGETYNIGGKSEKENFDVAKLICNKIDKINGKLSPKEKRTNLIKFVKDRPGHDLRYAVNFNKIKKHLGWKPEKSFNTGISETIHWYLNNKTWVDRVRSGEYKKWIKQQYN